MYNIGGAIVGVLIFSIIVSFFLVFIFLYISKFRGFHFFETLGKILAIILGLLICGISIYLALDQNIF